MTHIPQPALTDPIADRKPEPEKAAAIDPAVLAASVKLPQRWLDAAPVVPGMPEVHIATRIGMMGAWGTQA